MSLSSIIRTECPTCKKVAVEVSRFKLGTTTIIRLQCGHILSQGSLSSDESKYTSIISSDGKRLRQYQIDAVKFFEENNVKGILADDPGLGKTIVASSLLRLHAAKLLPAVIAVPASVKIQWLHEIIRWCADPKLGFADPAFLTQVIKSSKDKALPGFKIYIVTYDMLKSEEMFSLVQDNLKLLILDEAHKIKNHLGERAKAVQKIAKYCQYFLPMTGTLLRNNAGEAFTALNLVAPQLFPSWSRFLRDYCDSYDTMYGTKVGGFREPENFRTDTKDIILRRKKEDVLKDLPALSRDFYHVELDPKLNKAYAAGLKELEELFYEDSDENSFSANSAKIVILTKLRHLTGISKTKECVDFVTEFLLSTDRKITIFVHHQDVMTILNSNLSNWCESGGFEKPLLLHSGLDADKRAELVNTFKNGNVRILIASTLAAGEGLNLQFCSDAIMLERQWNPASEEQAEGRFHRFGQTNNVTITYMIASGTIDDVFTKIVEEKRTLIGAAMDGREVNWNQNSLFKELTEALVLRGRKEWKL